MRYGYYDLGELAEGTTVTVGLSGSSANVILLDETNFRRYQRGGPTVYKAGGFYRRTPVHLEIPEDEHWYLVVDLGGYSGRVRATVNVHEDGDPAREVSQQRAERRSRVAH